jgi:vacuolar-type H+-ATPase subunit H
MEEKKLKDTPKTEDEAWLALKKVKETEEKARLMIEETRQKTSPEIIRKAAEEAENLRKKIVAEAKVEAEKLKKDIIEKAEAEALSIKEQAEVEKQQLLKKAEENFDRAVEKTAAKLLTIIKNRKS